MWESTSGKEGSDIAFYKIDKYTLHYLSTEELRQRLSPTELAYATRHQALLHNHYLSSFLSSFPQRLQNLNDTAGNVSMIDSPDLDTAVFIRLLRDKDVFGRGTDVDSILPAASGDILILRWSSAKDLVEYGDAELVWRKLFFFLGKRNITALILVKWGRSDWRFEGEILEGKWSAEKLTKEVNAKGLLDTTG